ncbi:MAG: NTP transferase domain-containing protein [Phycisphaerae bacterium]|nr:NTP transferase domain-containing protein [Phycisphaerae bacterium]
MEKAIAILAAGIGSRFGGFKQMDPIGPNGEFIIDYSVYDAIRAGFNKVVFIIRHDIEGPFEKTIGKRVGKLVETCYAFQELDDLPVKIARDPNRTKPWGTVQALLACVDTINEPYAILNADDFYGRESYEVLSRYLDRISAADSNACMVGFQLDHTLSKYGSVTRGICQSNQNSMLQAIEETPGIHYEGDNVFYEDHNGTRKGLNNDDLVSMNMWGFDPSLFGAFREEFVTFLETQAHELKSELVIPTAVNLLIGKGKATVRVLHTPSDWFGITYPEDKAGVKEKTNALIEAGVYPENLWG